MAGPTETSNPISTINHGVNFETFFNGWLIHQQNFHDQLLQALSPENINHNDEEQQYQALIDQVMYHYQQYYQEKSIAARQDVLVFFSPPWFTAFERTFFWVGGFKPTFVFKLLDDSSVEDLTEEQEREVQQIKRETRREERELDDTMAKIQETLASPPLLSLMRRFGDHCQLSELDSAETQLLTAMLVALESADALRGKVARGVVEILSPIQTVKVLAAAAQLHLKARRCGLQWDQRTATTATT
ncbi:hypothetical protein Ddye_006566 [Dipteronia dyeriana]|uniref:DOG1 domain-containing protein n=1 Tax=Dipteronia dyeriana TaxID=168575 RepID=A0AAD9XIP0_9ROSI|nr:hypothetical protein Ddye_006566 [Dipteronia dyeriana]